VPVSAGAFAEYIAVRRDGLAPAENLTFGQAAVPLAAVTALQGLRAGGSGRASVLIMAPQAAWGLAVQIAGHLCPGERRLRTRHADLVRRLGAGQATTTPSRTSPAVPPATTWPFAGGPILQRRSRRCSHPADTHPVLQRRQPLVRPPWAASSRPLP
jgi:hypothetical protein